MAITLTGHTATDTVLRRGQQREPFRAQVGECELVGRLITPSRLDDSIVNEVNDRTPVRTLAMLATAIKHGETFLITLDAFPIAWHMQFWLITQYELPTVMAEMFRGTLGAALRP